MQFDPRRRVYVNPDGSIVSPAELRQLIENYISDEQEVISKEADRLIAAGASTVAISAFFEFMREKLKEIHGAAGLTAYGGESEMTPERWARIGEKIASEYKYLNGFEQALEGARKSTDEIIQAVSRVSSVHLALVERAILTNPPSEVLAALSTIVENPAIVDEVVTVAEPLFDSLIWGEVGSRARLYADSTYGTFENSQKAREGDAGVLSGRRIAENDSSTCDGCAAAATEEYLALDEILDIGDAECMSNCRCTIEFDYSGVEPLTIGREVYA